MNQNGDQIDFARPPAQSVLDRRMSVRHFVPTRQSRPLTHYPTHPPKRARAKGRTFKSTFTLTQRLFNYNSCSTPKVREFTRGWATGPKERARAPDLSIEWLRGAIREAPPGPGDPRRPGVLHGQHNPGLPHRVLQLSTIRWGRGEC